MSQIKKNSWLTYVANNVLPIYHHNSLKVINVIKSKRYIVSEINTLFKEIFIGIVEKTVSVEKTPYIAAGKKKALFSNVYNNCLYWPCEDVL